MKATRRWRPEVEALEERTVLSAGHQLAVTMPILTTQHGHHPKHSHHHHAAHGKSAGHSSGATQLSLSGSVSGTWQSSFTNPDVGRSQDLTGTGAVDPLGAVQLSGQLQTTGFIAQGQATGTLTLTTAKGSVTLSLVGPLQAGFSPPPSTFQYTVTGGTGAYANASGSGIVSFQEQQSTPFVCPPNAMCVPLVNSGTFTMIFQS